MKNTLFKNTILTAALTLSFFCIAIEAKAEFTDTKCSYVLTHSGNVQINRRLETSSGICFISIHPMDVNDELRYRDYYFDNNGFFMVFNSYSPRPDAISTGARDFFVLNKKYDYPDFSIEPNGDVLVRMVSGHIVRFDYKNFDITDFSPGTFVLKELDKNNQGGLEISPKGDFWIDGGFLRGNSPLSRPTGTSLIKSAKKPNGCSVVNKEFLRYADDNFELRFQTPAQWSKFLNTKCPGLL